jgi:BRCT domain type II-containing protein
VMSPPGNKSVPPSDVQVPVESGVLLCVPPQGREGCLEGYKVACTGVMGVLMGREDVEGLILQYGGKVCMPP